MPALMLCRVPAASGGAAVETVHAWSSLKGTARLIVLLAIAFPILHSSSAPAAGGGQISAVTGDLRVVEIDSSAYPTVESVVVVPRALSRQSLSSESFEVRQGDAVLPVEVVPLDPSALELVMVVDASAAIGDGFFLAQGGLLELPVHLSEPKLAVVRAAHPARVVLPLTADPLAVSKALTSLEPGGADALAEGLELAVEQFSVTGNARRAILVVAGDATIDDPVRLMRLAASATTMGATVYVISLGDGAPTELALLASITSGRVIAPDRGTIVAAVDQIVADLRGQYRLRIRLPGADGLADAEDRPPGEVVAVLGLQSVAATVHADGTSAEVRLPIAIPPSVASDLASTAAERSNAAAAVSDGLIVGAVLLLVAAAMALASAAARLALARPDPGPGRSAGEEAAAAASQVDDAATGGDESRLLGVGPADRR
jgi:von Willebrand factor type A domain